MREVTNTDIKDRIMVITWHTRHIIQHTSASHKFPTSPRYAPPCTPQITSIN